MDWSNTRYNLKNGQTNHAQAVASTAATGQSVFDVMNDIAKVWLQQFYLTTPAHCLNPSVSRPTMSTSQDPAVLELFNPYLPKTSRTHAGLAGAMTIAKWRNQVLVGESQVQYTTLLLPFQHFLSHTLPVNRQPFCCSSLLCTFSLPILACSITLLCYLSCAHHVVMICVRANLQIRESEIMTNVWRRAPDRDKLNKELQQLGFPGLMQQ